VSLSSGRCDAGRRHWPVDWGWGYAPAGPVRPARRPPPGCRPLAGCAAERQQRSNHSSSQAWLGIMLPALVGLAHTALQVSTAAPAPSAGWPISRREATFQSAIICQEGELDPGAFQDCIFTATEDRAYTFVWASRTVDFDVIKLGVEPVSSVYIGNRFGMYFTDCCSDAAGEDMPCEWLNSNVIRYRGTCASGDVSPVPGGAPPPAPPPVPEPEPEPGLDPNPPRIQETAYTGIVVRLFLRQGQSVLMMSEDQGLMSTRNASRSARGRYTPLAPEDRHSLAARASRAIVGREEKAIVCGGDGPNPRTCTFTAGLGAPGQPDTVYSFFFSSSASTGPFDIIKLGIDPLRAVHIGNRVGMVYTDCVCSPHVLCVHRHVVRAEQCVRSVCLCSQCAAEPGEPTTTVCTFRDPPLVRYEGTCTTTSSVEPIGFVPPEPEPEPEPPRPEIPCCALEPTGACQRRCECTTAPGEEPIDAYCRGSPPAPAPAPRATLPNIGGSLSNKADRHQRRLGESSYSSLVVQLVMTEGQRVTILPSGDGLM
jgi:hypothetical protein